MDIIVKIRIPEGEYKKWDDYETKGIDIIKKELRRDFNHHLDELGIEADLEIIMEK